MLVTEVGAVIGVGEPTSEAVEEDPELANLSPGARRAIERLRADAEGRPPPEPEASPGALALMQQGM